MESLLSSLKINVSSCLFIKDPESSDLGQNIIVNSIDLIDDLGLEDFNFKKLGIAIQSNESSIYRYFENKYKLLQYLSALYWGILEYRLVIETNAVENNSKKLLKAIKVLTVTPQNVSYYSNLDQIKLRNIVISEFTKSYHHKHVDSDNNEGIFKNYKRLILRLVEMIQDANPDYKFPKSLATQIIEGGLQQNFMQRHFTSLVDSTKDEQICNFFEDITINALKLKQI